MTFSPRKSMEKVYEATEHTELPNGCPIKQGTAVIVMYGAANVDATQCPVPFDVLLDRDSNRHIALGGGVTVAWAHISPGESCESRSPSGTDAYLTTGSSRATNTSSTRPVSDT
jgi:hypothetical protein